MTSNARFRDILTATLCACGLASVLVMAGRPAGTSDLEVHEWGTFTSVAGADGQAESWRPFSGPSDLPCFVHVLKDGPKTWVPGGLPAVNALVRDGRLLLAAVPQHDGELVAPQPGAGVGGAGAAAQHRGHRAEDPVALGVPPRVVERLEVVEVEEGDGERAPVAPGAGQLHLDALQEGPLVVEPGQRIAAHQLAEGGVGALQRRDQQAAHRQGRHLDDPVPDVDRHGDPQQVVAPQHRRRAQAGHRQPGPGAGAPGSQEAGRHVEARHRVVARQVVEDAGDTDQDRGGGQGDRRREAIELVGQGPHAWSTGSPSPSHPRPVPGHHHSWPDRSWSPPPACGNASPLPGTRGAAAGGLKALRAGPAPAGLEPRHPPPDEADQLLLRRRRPGPDQLAVDEEGVGLPPGLHGGAIRGVDQADLDLLPVRRRRPAGPLEGEVLRRAPAAQAGGDRHLPRRRVGTLGRSRRASAGPRRRRRRASRPAPRALAARPSGSRGGGTTRPASRTAGPAPTPPSPSTRAPARRPRRPRAGRCPARAPAGRRAPGDGRGPRRRG